MIWKDDQHRQKCKEEIMVDAGTGGEILHVQCGRIEK